MEINMGKYMRHIVEKDGRYLVGHVVNGVCRYSTSVYDAWFTNDISTANRVARKLKGRRRTFNYLTGVVES